MLKKGVPIQNKNDSQSRLYNSQLNGRKCVEKLKQKINLHSPGSSDCNTIHLRCEIDVSSNDWKYHNN